MTYPSETTRARDAAAQPENAMKSFVLACVAAVVIAAGAAFVLDHLQRSAEAAYSTTGARV